MAKHLKGFLRLFLYGLVFLVSAGLGVYLVASLFVKSPGEVTVPDLTGRDMVMALEVLTRDGLGLKLKGFEYSETIGRNLVADQDPAPGSVVRRGRDVFVVISQGSERVIVPAVRGMELTQAVYLLEENGLARGKVSQMHFEDRGEGLVAAQQPEPHVELKRGAEVDLLVSLGKRPRTFIMPELRGRRAFEAMSTVEEMGLTVGEVEESFTPGIEEETVVHQHPLSGYPVKKGERVFITVNRRAATGGAGLAPFFFSLPPEPGLFDVSVKAHGPEGERLLYTGTHTGGETVTLALWLEPGEEARVYVDGQDFSNRSLTEVWQW